ncbi:hypothetical protein HELRODRAFT_182927 [Helobdella robusta]|uniref:SCP domain-containing protein n=1 Tax=Helobdella robusta TaxID=6412 RepID=T1FIX7_HELRO|nr:hypothetical protein HELRODRAFT_182927 [Helobdella robusta]ESN90022.1 hypothetical protein HELRODRAFT_182927 [Helobdella robusta]
MLFKLLLICSLTVLGCGSEKLTDDQIAEVLKIHNKLRKNEGASDMKVLRWNGALAEKADAWSEKCVFEHGNPDMPKSNFYIGQNLYASSQAPETVNYESVVRYWFSEKENYNLSTRTCAKDKICGHYTQVVWAKTTDLGCAHAVCQKLGNLYYTNGLFVVCNYAPG